MEAEETVSSAGADTGLYRRDSSFSAAQTTTADSSDCITSSSSSKFEIGTAREHLPSSRSLTDVAANTAETNTDDSESGANSPSGKLKSNLTIDTCLCDPVVGGAAPAAVTEDTTEGGNFWDEQLSFKVLCPQKQIGLIIGRSGATINALNASSGARVKISQNREYFPATEDRIIVLQGSFQNLNVALKDLVLQIIEAKRRSMNRSGLLVSAHNQYDVRVLVPRRAAGALIGKDGIAIQRLCAESNCHMQFGDIADPYDTRERIITIYGSAPETVTQGVLLVLKQLVSDPKTRNYDSLSTMYNADVSRGGEEEQVLLMMRHSHSSNSMSSMKSDSSGYSPRHIMVGMIHPTTGMISPRGEALPPVMVDPDASFQLSPRLQMNVNMHSAPATANMQTLGLPRPPSFSYDQSNMMMPHASIPNQTYTRVPEIVPYQQQYLHQQYSQQQYSQMAHTIVPGQHYDSSSSHHVGQPQQPYMMMNTSLDGQHSGSRLYYAGGTSQQYQRDVNQTLATGMGHNYMGQCVTMRTSSDSGDRAQSVYTPTVYIQMHPQQMHMQHIQPPVTQPELPPSPSAQQQMRRIDHRRHPEHK